MFQVTENGKTYMVGLRGAYDRIRSEKHLRKAVQSGIQAARERGPIGAAYADGLEKKLAQPGGLWEVCNLFGMVSTRVQIDPDTGRQIR